MSQSVEEKKMLDAKIVELRNFIAGEKFCKGPADVQNLLREQLQTMKVYSNILNQRIIIF